jgi:hypothetical protein
MTGPSDLEPLAALRRWEDSGGTWRVVRDDGTEVVLDLLTCSGGEVMATLRSDDAELRRYVLEAESGAAGTEPS